MTKTRIPFFARSNLAMVWLLRNGNVKAGIGVKFQATPDAENADVGTVAEGRPRESLRRILSSDIVATDSDEIF